jgi:hypothetical protein
VSITLAPQGEGYHSTEISVTKEDYVLLGAFFKSSVGNNWTFIMVSPFYYSSEIDFNLYNPTSSPIALSAINYNVVWVKTS